MPREVATDVLVLGAGPAGSAAATTIARNGLNVALVDRFEFPREKVCGDALIPDALNAIRCLGLEQTVKAEARRLGGVRVYAPNGAYVFLQGQCASLPRRRLDQILRDNAIRAGAAFFAPYELKRPCCTSRITGAILQNRSSGEELTISAPITVLATGAGIEGIDLFGVTDRREPSAVALRAYFEAPPALSDRFDHLCISYDRSVAPGYGWIFPGPHGTFNVGVGRFFDRRTRSSSHNITRLWKAFIERFEPARELVTNSRQASPLKGAPLRTAMAGSKLSKPGLLVIGEAAGMTYPFSGEGIGKAMASGIIAGELIARFRRERLPLAGTGAVYAERLGHEFRSRFNAYESAQRWLNSPAFANFLTWRANAGSFVKEQLEGLFNETADPRTLFSVRGMVRSLLG
jgi:geranylgeranyl reductase family protein